MTWRRNKVVNSAGSQFAQSYNNIQLGNGTVADVQAVTTSAQILFAHFDEVGLTAYSDQLCQQSASQLSAGFTPSDQFVSTIQGGVTAQGASLSADQVRTMFTLSSAQTSAALQYQAQVKISGVDVAGVNDLSSVMQAMPNSGGPTLPLQGYASLFAGDDPMCGNFQLVIDTILVVAALYGGAVLLGCLPCGVIAAVLVLFAAALQLVKDLIC